MDAQNILTGINFRKRTSEHKPEAPKFILIIEGDEAAHKFCTNLLLHAEYQVGEVANGLEALEALKNDNYDLLITGKTAPTMTSFELVMELCDEKMHEPENMSMGSMSELKSHQNLSPKHYSNTDLLMAVHLTLLMVFEQQNQNREPSFSNQWLPDEPDFSLV